MGTFFDAALVQLGWWACVLGAARGQFLLGPAVVAVLLAVQTLGLPAAARRRAWRGMLLLGAAGTAIDSLHGALGVLDFRGAAAGWLGVFCAATDSQHGGLGQGASPQAEVLGALAPLWITALWCQFATVLPAFAPLRTRPLVAGLLGAVGGPLAYAGGARLGAAGLHPEPWISLLVIGAVWAVAFPVMLRTLVTPDGATSPEPVASPGAAPAS